MNKTRILQLIFSLFILFFSACTDHQYDLDDEKVDKNGVFSPDGINIPIGQIDTIFVDKELIKSYDNSTHPIRVDENGVLYMEYAGEFPFVFPEFQAPTIAPMHTSPIHLQNIPPGTITLPQAKLVLVDGGLASYTIDKPVLTNEQENLQIHVEKINYTYFSVDVSFDLSGIRFGEGEADLILTLDYPESFVLEGHNSTIQKTIRIEPNKTHYEIKDACLISAFKYSEISNLQYRLELDIQSGLVVTTSGDAPQFAMTLSANNSTLQVESLECRVEGRETIQGVIDIENFATTYPDYILRFDNPLLEFSLETNLGFDFSADLHVSSNAGSASLSDDNHLQFNKPTQPYPQTQTTSYLLSPRNPGNAPHWKPFNMNETFYHVPSYLEYEANAYFDDDAVLYFNDARLNTRYKLTLPFVFSNLDINIRDTIPDLFSEDLYERLFEYAQGDIQIIADSVAVHIDNGISINVEADLLDENGRSVGISAVLDNVLNGGRDDNRIVIQISKADKEKMKDARHLEFVFNIQGHGAITDRDYIHIRRIRITSDDGIYFTF
ncbi:MAG: hypothetical protein LBS46_02505 [Dysgonamonadaceae bacterium]|jgi:hypothetical protein|nr:hypothetical protein [Dysgonamonadaceae bacterium]